MSSHLKRIAAPRSWHIGRTTAFVVKPLPGSQPLARSMALGSILRDVLKLAGTMGEVKKLLRSSPVLVDGVQQFKPQVSVGLFDVISIPGILRHYRLLLDRKGRLQVVPISAGEAGIKPCKVIGKTMLVGGKTQLNLFDGKNITSAGNVKVGDSVLLELPSQNVREILPLNAGCPVLLIGGKYAGDSGVLREVHGSQAEYEHVGKKISTSKEYLFVVGGKQSAISINSGTG